MECQVFGSCAGAANNLKNPMQDMQAECTKHVSDFGAYELKLKRILQILLSVMNNGGIVFTFSVAKS